MSSVLTIGCPQEPNKKSIGVKAVTGDRGVTCKCFSYVCKRGIANVGRTGRVDASKGGGEGGTARIGHKNEAVLDLLHLVHVRPKHMDLCTPLK